MDPNPEKLIRQTLHGAKKLKAKALRDGPDAPIPSIVEYYRDGTVICQAVADVDTIMPTIAPSITGFNADAVAFISDAYAYKSKTKNPGHINPITGKPWDLGDMDRMAKEDAAVERGLLVETLMVHYEERPGDTIWTGTVTYELKTGRRRSWFVWDEMSVYEVSAETVGQRDGARIPRRIGQGWRTPPLLTDPNFADWTQAQMDCAMALFLERVGLTVIAGPEPVEIPDVDRWFN